MPWRRGRGLRGWEQKKDACLPGRLLTLFWQLMHLKLSECSSTDRASILIITRPWRTASQAKVTPTSLKSLGALLLSMRVGAPSAWAFRRVWCTRCSGH